MDVTDEEQAKIAEQAGACAVMALQKVPADIIRDGGVARMASPTVIKKIKGATSIPVMAKARIGHFAEAQILEELQVDFIDESEVLTATDLDNFIPKHEFKTPFVCGCQNLVEALKRISEGASMIRIKGKAGTGNVSYAVQHLRTIRTEIEGLTKSSLEWRQHYAKLNDVPLKLVEETVRLNRIPAVTFAAGGIATPADASLMMQLGADGIFVGSGIFKSSEPMKMATAIVQATTNYNNSKLITDASMNIGEAMN